jgi:hypothetical protein
MLPMQQCVMTPESTGSARESTSTVSSVVLPQLERNSVVCVARATQTTRRGHHAVLPGRGTRHSPFAVTAELRYYIFVVIWSVLLFSDFVSRRILHFKEILVSLKRWVSVLKLVCLAPFCLDKLINELLAFLLFACGVICYHCIRWWSSISCWCIGRWGPCLYYLSIANHEFSKKKKIS